MRRKSGDYIIMSDELYIANSMSTMISSFKNVHDFFHNTNQQNEPQEVVDKLTELADDTDKFMKYAKEVTLDAMNADGRILPGYLFISKKGAVCPVILQEMPSHGLERELLFSSIAALLQTSPIDAYMFSSEVWMATQTNNPSLSDLPPSQRSDRKEGVFIRVANRQGSKVSFMNVVRHDDKVSFSSEEKLNRAQCNNVLMDDIYALSQKMKGL